MAAPITLILMSVASRMTWKRLTGYKKETQQLVYTYRNDKTSEQTENPFIEILSSSPKIFPKAIESSDQASSYYQAQEYSCAHSQPYLVILLGTATTEAHGHRRKEY